jgi:predicted RNase H-like HicB family nuclease
VKFQVLLEYEPKSTSWCATVSGLPIVVDANSEREAIHMAKEAIELYFDSTKRRQRSFPARPPGKAKLVTVEI